MATGSLYSWAAWKSQGIPFSPTPFQLGRVRGLKRLARMIRGVGSLDKKRAVWSTCSWDSAAQGPAIMTGGFSGDDMIKPPFDEMNLIKNPSKIKKPHLLGGVFDMFFY